jgi:hypothetical protein
MLNVGGEVIFVNVQVLLVFVNLKIVYSFNFFIAGCPDCWKICTETFMAHHMVHFNELSCQWRLMNNFKNILWKKENKMPMYVHDVL